MGRNRPKAGSGAVEAQRYDIFGNAVAEATEESVPQPVQPPVPAPVEYTNERTLAVAKKAEYDRNAPYEIMTMLDDDGNVIVRKDGERRQVTISRMSDIAWDRAAVITHNHPNASSFSSDDFIAMHDRGLSGLEARAPVFNKTERAFVNEVIAAMTNEMKRNPLQLNPYLVNANDRKEAKQLTKDFIKELMKQLKVFSRNKTKPWRFIVTNPKAIRNPPAESRVNANTSTEELLALFITEGAAAPNPNNQNVRNMSIPRRKQMITSALQSMDTSESNLRAVASGVRLSLRDSRFWQRNPERASQLTNMIINSMFSHASNQVVLRDSTYQYAVVFE